MALLSKDKMQELIDDIRKRANIEKAKPIQTEDVNNVTNALGRIFKDNEYVVVETQPNTYVIRLLIVTDSMIDFDDIEKIQRMIKGELKNFDVSFFGVSPHGDDSLILSFWTFEI